MLLLLAGAGCAPMEEDSGSSELGTTTQDMVTLNGLAFNGLAFNGLAFNGLSSEAFSSWFKSDPALADMVMRYTVECAVPAGQSRTYKYRDTTYTWYGWLGLARDWASGAPATEAEQQIITACLAAHANKYGKHILISVLGQGAQGQTIPVSSWELSTFPEREACFFGNLFTGEGIYVGNDRGMLDERESTPRACALSTSANDARDACPPLIYVGSCQGSCEKDSTGNGYTRCTSNGITYLPLTTRMLSQDIYRCGDGVCQFTESCGTGQQYDNCRSDCGLCP
ncbi:MAG: hypothetical protein ACXU86_09815 [Archangium sp.]